MPARTLDDVRAHMVSELLGTLHRTRDADLERLSGVLLAHETAPDAAGLAPVFAVMRQAIGAEALTRLPAHVQATVLATAGVR